MEEPSHEEPGTPTMGRRVLSAEFQTRPRVAPPETLPAGAELDVPVVPVPEDRPEPRDELPPQPVLQRRVNVAKLANVKNNQEREADRIMARMPELRESKIVVGKIQRFMVKELYRGSGSGSIVTI